MEVKDIDTIYSDYLKVRELLKGKALFGKELEKLCKEEGISTNAIEAMKTLGQIETKKNNYGIPNNKLILKSQPSNPFSIVGTKTTGEAYTEFKINRGLTPDGLLELIGNYFEKPIEDIKGKSRKRPLVKCRQMFCSIIRQFKYDLSLKDIGSYLGNRDHSTVINSIRNNENDILYAQGYKEEFEKIKKLIYTQLI